MNEPEYMRAINDARELLVAEGNKACDEGKNHDAIVIARCSQKIATLIAKPYSN